MGKRTLTVLGLYVALGALIWLAVAKLIPSLVALPLILAALIYMLFFIVSPYIPPSWIKRVGQNGKDAIATVLSNDFAKAGGVDLWAVIPVDVKPADGTAFKAKMRCKTSQAATLAVGAAVSVRYDGKSKKQVLMTGENDDRKKTVSSQ